MQNVVAPQGTALTADHARILKRHVDEVILCFDSDNAGQNAAIRSLDNVLGSGLAVRVAALPAPHDPDSFIKEFGGTAFARLIEEARGFFDYYLDRLCSTEDPESDRGRQAVVEAMAEALHKTGSAVLLDTHAQKTALRLSVSADAVRAAFKKSARAAAGPPASSDEEDAPATAPTVSRPPENEAWLLRIALESDDLMEWVAGHLQLEWLTNAAVRELISRRLQAHADGSWKNAAAWLSQIEDPGWKNLVTEILTDSRPVRDPESVLKGAGPRDGALKILRDRHIDRQLAALTQRLADPALDEAEQTSLLTQTQRLRQQKREPLHALSDT